MAAPTLLFAVLTGAAVLGLTTLPRPGTRAGPRLRWPVWSVLAAFLAPPLLGRAHAALLRTGAIEPQLLTAGVALGFSLVLALMFWRYASRLAAAQRAQALVLAELEDRVRERTQALTASNDELRRHEETLRTADRRKDEFLALLAHELRNPLAPIRTAAHIVGTTRRRATQQRRAGAIIERQVAVMRRLIDDLLDVSRITAGKLQIRPAARVARGGARPGRRHHAAGLRRVRTRAHACRCRRRRSTSTPMSPGWRRPSATCCTTPASSPTPRRRISAWWPMPAPTDRWR